MADDEVINPLGSPTTNYGWTKPAVGADDDVWGGMLNADLDSIDTTVKSVSTVANGDPASNPSGYQTAAQVTAAVPVASSTTPAANGTAAVGTGTTWARADHVHPTDTSGWLGDNRIINGDMRIDQRNGGASGTAAGYMVDRWGYFPSINGKGTWGRNGGGSGLSGPSGFPYCLSFVSSSAYAAASSDTFSLGQAIEADQISDFQWGTAGAQPVTLSFWVYSNLTGTFGGAIANYGLTRAYPFSYSIPVANTWTKIVLTIPGDIGGAWVMSGNAGAIYLFFDLGSGTAGRGSANVWASATYRGATGTVSVVATNGASFYVTGVKLEIGSVATPYNRQSLAKSMADCQRYYQTPTLGIVAYAGATGQNVGGFAYLATTMRAAPTLAVLAAVGSDSNVSGVNTPDLITTTTFRGSWVATAAGICTSGRQYSASAEL